MSESDKVEAMPMPVAYWPPEEDSGVMPAEVTSEHKRELPACRPGWHAPDESGLECHVCGRPILSMDQPIVIAVAPGAVPSLLRVIGAGARQIGNGQRTEDTIDDLSVAASVMASLLRQQKLRAMGSASDLRNLNPARDPRAP
jgi:hypothetical protein